MAGYFALPFSDVSDDSDVDEYVKETVVEPFASKTRQCYDIRRKRTKAKSAQKCLYLVFCNKIIAALLLVIALLLTIYVMYKIRTKREKLCATANLISGLTETIHISHNRSTTNHTNVTKTSPFTNVSTFSTDIRMTPSTLPKAVSPGSSWKSTSRTTMSSSSSSMSSFPTSLPLNMHKYLPTTTVTVPQTSDHATAPHVKLDINKEWIKILKDTDTESCIRLLDVDGDGVLDIILGLATGLEVSGEMTPDLAEKTCRSLGMEPPCFGTVVALKGINGAQLWSFYTYSEVFEINCNIDIDKDGKTDCVGAGRLGTLVAFNPYEGTVLWRVSPKIVNHQWNIYNPLILSQDYTGDGVKELVIAHGGEPRLPPEEHNRTSGRLVMLNGANGMPVGRHFDVPENRETYMSPIIYSSREGNEYILFGSGGETVAGSLYAISTKDFYDYVIGIGNTSLSTVNDSWTTVDKMEHGIIEIYRSKVKGVMVPPVIVDVNKDGENDILLSTFDGTLSLRDGRDLNAIWERKFHNQESYSNPAPGYFNNDDIIDFMVHWSLGEWPTYTTSSTMILDGKNGHTLWMTNTSQYEMSSDLVVRSTEPSRDLFVFRMQGRDSNDAQTGSNQTSVVHGIHPQRVINKRSVFENSTNWGSDDDISDNASGYADYELADDADQQIPECDIDLGDFKSEVLILDRSSQLEPIKVAEIHAEKIFYNLTESNEIDDKSLNPTSGTLCAVLKPEERTTGAIGDLDGDGKLNLVVAFGMNAQLRDNMGGYVKMKYQLRVLKIDLELKLKKPKHVKLDFNYTFIGQNEPSEKKIEQLIFRPYDQQRWTEYMGRFSDSNMESKRLL